MKLISELVDYFSELLTEEQKNAARQLGVIPSGGPDDDYFEDRYYEEYDPYYDRDPYDEYELPAPDRRMGHAAGKRRPPRRRAMTAARLAADFRKGAKAWIDFDIFIALAEKHDRNYLSELKRAGEWRRFMAAVACLKDLDADALGELLRQLLAEQKATGGTRFYDFFVACGSGSLTYFAKNFCRRRVDGAAGRATLAALRDIAYPETVSTHRNTNLVRPFMENPDIAGIFDYYHVLRKLEYIYSQTGEEAVRRLKNGHR